MPRSLSSSVCLSISVVKKNNVIQLHVDSTSQHGVGPKQKRQNGGQNKVYLGSAPGKDLQTFHFLNNYELALLQFFNKH